MIDRIWPKQSSQCPDPLLGLPFAKPTRAFSKSSFCVVRNVSSPVAHRCDSMAYVAERAADTSQVSTTAGVKTSINCKGGAALAAF